MQPKTTFCSHIITANSCSACDKVEFQDLFTDTTASLGTPKPILVHLIFFPKIQASEFVSEFHLVSFRPVF